MISEGFWSEWGDLNTQPRHPKCRALPVELHPDIHFSAMIPRRGVKIKIFLSVVIYVVKSSFIPLSAIVESPANAGVTRLCGVSPCPVPDTATALPNHALYHLSYTRLWNWKPKLSVVSHVVKGEFLGDSGNCGKPAIARVARLCGVSPWPVPGTATAHPNHMPYQLGYTWIQLHYTMGRSEKARKICVPPMRCWEYR